MTPKEKQTVSAATDAKSARARATIAMRMLRTQKSLGRSFDDCFEMGDGDAVVVLIVQAAYRDPAFAAILRRKGYGYWLEPDYFKDMGMTDQHPFASQAADS